MLQLMGALFLVAGVCEASESLSKQVAPECIDHSGEKIVSAEKAPRCWADLATEPENGHRVSGSVVSLPLELRGVSIETPRVTFKLCIGETGRVEKALKLLSSGSAAIDAFYCTELTRWRFRPKQVGEAAVRSVELVTVTLHR